MRANATKTIEGRDLGQGNDGRKLGFDRFQNGETEAAPFLTA
jgi:hypothetical protein